MKRLVASLLSVLLLAAVGLPTAFLVLYWTTVPTPSLYNGFWQTLMATWMATLIGLGAGLPLGLYVSRTIERESTERAAANARADQEATRRRMLGSLLAELEALIEALPDLTSGGFEVLRISAPLTHTLSAAGAMLIADQPATLLELAQVDDAVRTVNRVNRQWQETLAQAAIAPAGSRMRDLLQLHESLLQAAANDLRSVSQVLIQRLRAELGDPG